jgi:biopolymer transport protein ExbD
MAEVEQSSGGGHGKKGGPKGKKKSTKVDMTAMVDVAFLLLTFFVLTATMSNNALISLTLPPKIDDPDKQDDLRKKMREDKIMTVVLGEDDKITYFVGAANEETELETSNYSANGLREVLLDHLNLGPQKGIPMCSEVNDAGINEGRCWDPIFVVKPREKSRYKNLVDILDEFAITEANKYAIDEFTSADSVFLADHVNPGDEPAEE